MKEKKILLCSLAILSLVACSNANSIAGATDEEKIARCKGYIAEVKNEERRKWLIFLIPVFMIVLLIVVSIIGLIALIKVLSKVGY